MFDLAKEIWQTMRASKLRTILTGLSVAWGVFMLILLLAIANGVVNANIEMAQSNDPNRISVWGGSTTLPFDGMSEGRKIDLRSRDFDAIMAANPDKIADVTADVSILGQISTSKDYLSSSAIGVFPQYFTQRYQLVSGRFVNEADIRQSRKVVVLHRQNAHALFDNPDDCVGKVVKIGDVAFVVVGVYDHKWESGTFIPFSTAVAISGYADTFNSINVHLKDIGDEKESGAVERQVVEALAQTERFDPADQGAVWTYDRFAGYVTQQRGTRILTAAMWVIGLLTLITGIVGVSNIMFVSVRERTHEIGIRRALGAKPRSILGQVVMESVALTTCFGYIGIVMGTLATEIVKRVFAGSDFMSSPSVDLAIAFEVTAALVVAGALAGIFPALRAIKVRPVEALRDE